VPSRDVLDFSATQAHVRLGWTGPGIDLSGSASTLLDPLGVPGLPPAAAFDGAVIALPVLHPRFAMFGTAGALTLGAFVLRWEAVFELSRPIALRDTSSPLLQFSSVRRHGLRGLLGVTYVPTASTNAALELLQGYVFDNPNRSDRSRSTLFPLEAPQLAVRITQRFFRDRAQASALWIRIGATDLNAWAARIELGYAVFDSLEAT
jgi:hypothetical protein